MQPGRTVGLFGLSGTGKTTQAGEYAKYIKKTTGKRTLLNAADYGGYDALEPHIAAGIVEANPLQSDANPWVWINAACTVKPPADVGLLIYDSGTSIAEALLTDCARQAAAGIQVGQEKIFQLKVPTGKGTTPLTIGTNNKAQYGLIQTYMMDMIRRSTWLARENGVDVLWTFGEHSGEDPNDDPVVGPKLAGKALTGTLPKELRYILRLDVQVAPGQAARHVLYTQQQPDRKGLGYSFGNARYPIDATTPLPPVIEPASLTTFWELIEKGKQEAIANLIAEVG
jgi:hypothetical protein